MTDGFGKAMEKKRLQKLASMGLDQTLSQSARNLLGVNEKDRQIVPLPRQETRGPWARVSGRSSLPVGKEGERLFQALQNQRSLQEAEDEALKHEQEKQQRTRANTFAKGGIERLGPVMPRPAEEAKPIMDTNAPRKEEEHLNQSVLAKLQTFQDKVKKNKEEKLNQAEDDSDDDIPVFKAPATPPLTDPAEAAESVANKRKRKEQSLEDENRQKEGKGKKKKKRRKRGGKSDEEDGNDSDEYSSTERIKAPEIDDKKRFNTGGLDADLLPDESKKRSPLCGNVTGFSDEALARRLDKQQDSSSDKNLMTEEEILAKMGKNRKEEAREAEKKKEEKKQVAHQKRQQRYQSEERDEGKKDRSRSRDRKDRSRGDRREERRRDGSRDRRRRDGSREPSEKKRSDRKKNRDRSDSRRRPRSGSRSRDRDRRRDRY